MSEIKIMLAKLLLPSVLFVLEVNKIGKAGKEC